MSTLRVVYLPHYLPEWPRLAYAKPGDAGFDLRAATEAPVTLRKGEIALVPTGIRVAVPQGNELQIRARSGLAAKHGVAVVNAPGTVDAGFRGEIKAILTCLKDEAFTIMPGDRIVQAVVAPVAAVTFAAVEDLDASERGEGGFGSSGVGVGVERAGSLVGGRAGHAI